MKPVNACDAQYEREAAGIDAPIEPRAGSLLARLEDSSDPLCHEAAMHFRILISDVQKLIASSHRLMSLLHTLPPRPGASLSIDDVLQALIDANKPPGRTRT